MKNTESLCIVYVGGESESTYQVTDRETENWGEGKHWKIAVDHSRKRGGKANGRGREKKFSPICRYVLTSLFSFLSYTYSHITDDCDAFRKDTDKRQKKKKKDVHEHVPVHTYTTHTLECNHQLPSNVPHPIWQVQNFNHSSGFC